ncbi:unnamed protein product [Trichogramma brassicae]|uniref:Uncharacterized protein n=1 Tax=Trichogramma brassicae TaxID=86971 RepID=A0A6H5HTX7_9HYME|nr:unnamed protein product [Trichogramma brassicae]
MKRCWYTCETDKSSSNTAYTTRREPRVTFTGELEGAYMPDLLARIRNCIPAICEFDRLTRGSGHNHSCSEEVYATLVQKAQTVPSEYYSTAVPRDYCGDKRDLKPCAIVTSRVLRYIRWRSLLSLLERDGEMAFACAWARCISRDFISTPRQKYRSSIDYYRHISTVVQRSEKKRIMRIMMNCVVISICAIFQVTFDASACQILEFHYRTRKLSGRSSAAE